MMTPAMSAYAEDARSSGLVDSEATESLIPWDEKARMPTRSKSINSFSVFPATFTLSDGILFTALTFLFMSLNLSFRSATRSGVEMDENIWRIFNCLFVERIWLGHL